MHFFPTLIIFSVNIEASKSNLFYAMLLLPICMTAISGFSCPKGGVTCYQSCIFAPLNDSIMHFALLKELFSLFPLIFFKRLSLTMSIFFPKCSNDSIISINWHYLFFLHVYHFLFIIQYNYLVFCYYGLVFCFYFDTFILFPTISVLASVLIYFSKCWDHLPYEELFLKNFVCSGYNPQSVA